MATLGRHGARDGLLGAERVQRLPRHLLIVRLERGRGSSERERERDRAREPTTTSTDRPIGMYRGTSRIRCRTKASGNLWEAGIQIPTAIRKEAGLFCRSLLQKGEVFAYGELFQTLMDHGARTVPPNDQRVIQREEVKVDPDQLVVNNNLSVCVSDGHSTGP